jgi:Asp/Glu/hydantoin racemase
MKRLALLHTVLFLADLFKKKIAARYPGLESFHVVDESLLPELMRSGGVLTPGLVRRIAAQAVLARDAGAGLILFTCSSTSPAVDLVRPLLDVPIVKIDDAMAVKAVQTGEQIGVICTAKTTFLPSQNLIRQHAARLGRRVNLQARLEAAAFEAVMAGDKARHDELVRQAAAELSLSCDVVVLAQASMAHLTAELNNTLKVPVLAGPDLCVEALAEELKD